MKQFRWTSALASRSDRKRIYKPAWLMYIISNASNSSITGHPWWNIWSILFILNRFRSEQLCSRLPLEGRQRAWAGILRHPMRKSRLRCARVARKQEIRRESRRLEHVSTYMYTYMKLSTSKRKQWKNHHLTEESTCTPCWPETCPSQWNRSTSKLSTTKC